MSGGDGTVAAAAARRFRRHGVVGAPVSCLSLPSRGLCVYGQGGWLERRRLPDEAAVTGPDGATHGGGDRILALDGVTGIHGIRYSGVDGSDLAVIYGGNELSILRNVLEPDRAMTRLALVRPYRENDPRNKDSVETGLETVHSLHLPDWIMDCQWTDREGGDGGSGPDDHNLAVGLAHNTVELWRLRLPSDSDGDAFGRICQIATIQGASRTIIYCMHMCGNAVAVGLPLRDVRIWSLDEPDREVCLMGHKGCIHAVRFKTSNLLASASDDRTVRLWERKEAEGGAWALKWTAWGHAARCWGLAFAARGLLSTGEDGTARLWDEQTGAPLAVLRGHACQSVWRVDAFGSCVVTGANDGSVALFDLKYQIRQQRQKGDPIASHSWEATYTVPMSCAPEGTVCARTSSLGEHVKTSKKTRQKESAIVGMDFFAAAGQSLQLLVASRQGAIQSLALDTGEWQLWCPWWDPSFDSLSVSKSDGCCFYVSPSGSWAVIGTSKGDIILVDRMRQVRSVLPSRNHRAVQKLLWVDDSLLLSFHIQTIILWSLHDGDGIHSADSEHVSRVQVFRPGLKGVPICCCVHKADSMLLIAGDTRGYLSLFNCDESFNDEIERHPSSTLRAHGREHVNAIACIGNRVYSVGNDGCIHESMLMENKHLVSLQSIKVSSFTAMDRVWNIPVRDGMIDRLAGGYFGNLYCVADLETGYEFFRVDTGGRQRNTCMYIDPMFDAGDSIAHTSDVTPLESRTTDISTTVPASYLAVSSMKKNGETEIEIYCNTLLGLFVSCAVARPMHGETIFDSCMFRLSEESIALLTASEDCFSRITILRNGDFFKSFLLLSQAGGVRALCACRLNKSNKTFVAAGGGKLELQFFFIHDLTMNSSGAPLVEHCGFGRASTKTSVDQRINALAAIAVDQMNVALVAAGDSEGKIYLYAVPAIQTGKPSHGTLVYCGERPILSLEIVRTSFHSLLLAGTTGGDVVVLDISPEVHDASIDGRILLTYRAHLVGTNAVVAKVIQGEADCAVVRVCSGGDDHSIHCTDLCFVSGAQNHPTLTRGVSAKGGSSAIRDLVFIDEKSFASCSYDCQLRQWEVSGSQVTCQSVLPVSVGDVNCMSHVAHGSSHLIAVSGCGTEMFISTPNNA